MKNFNIKVLNSSSNKHIGKIGNTKFDFITEMMWFSIYTLMMRLTCMLRTEFNNFIIFMFVGIEYWDGLFILLKLLIPLSEGLMDPT